MTTNTIKTTFKLRRGTAEAWKRNNPILAYGEPGFDKDNYGIKIGDGSTPWNDLEFVGVSKEVVEQLINDYFEENPGVGGEGKPGKDGISATHSWNGTILTISSASGTSSADLIGPQGPQGEDGAQGPQGEKGLQGEQGEPGRGITSILRTSGNGAPGTNDIYTITFTDNTSTTFTVHNGSNGFNGEKGKKGDDGFSPSVQMTETDNGVIITVDNKNGATTAFIKNGEKGEQGIQGKTGEKGDKGDKGDKGEDGTGVTILGSFDTEEELKLAHPTGEIGHSYLVAGSLYVWSTTENDWVNVGNIQGPKGDKGDIGETGPKGETGKDGAPGKSAYEYAKEAGYAKTESDFAQKLAAENYTKNEVDDLITSSIAKANHLQRTIVQSSLSIDPNAEGAGNFIYMVPKSDSLSEDHYDEFMVIDGKVEKVGDWAVNLDGYATEEYVDKIVSTIDTDASLLVLVDISTMTANYSKTEIINASKAGKVVYADVSNQLFVLKNALNASFTEMLYLTGGTKIDLTSFYIDDEKKVHLNVSDTFNLLPNYSTSDYGKYVTPSTNGLVYRELPNPVQSVNNKTGAVILTASDVGARPSTWMPSASDVGALPDSTEIPSELSDLNEDANHRLVTDTEKATWNAKSNFSGSYDDLTNKPAIPSITGLASTTYVDNAVKDKVDKDGNKVLSTNDYTTAEKNKLANIAAGAEVNVNADWNATSGDAQILNKPTLGSMAAKNSVAKGDLASEVQTSLGKADSALQPSDISDWAKAAAKPTYTASEVGALPDSTKIPSKLGDLDNDKQYITAAEVPDEIYVGDGTMPNTATIQFIMDASDEEALLKDELQEYINTEIEAAKTKLELDIPEKTSQLTNDSGFITAEDIPEVQVPDLSDYAKTKDIPTKTSQLTNDSGFITQHQSLAGYAKTSDIPTKVSQLTNDSGFITAKDIPQAQVPDLSGYALKSNAETWTFTLSDGSTVTKKVVLA